LKKIKNIQKKGKRKGNRNTILLAILLFIFTLPLYAVEEYGGSVSLGASYDSNPGADLESSGQKSRSLKNIGDFSMDFSSDLFIYPVKNLYLDYFTALTYTFQNEGYSFFLHAADIAYEGEFSSFDLNTGLQFGHIVYDFNEAFNRIEAEPYLEIVHYQSDALSGWYRLSFQYRKPFYFYDIYYEGFKIAADIGELVTFMNGKSSFLLNSVICAYILENSTEIYDTATVDKKNSYLSFSQNIRLKLGFGIFSMTPGFEYELLYFFANDEWNDLSKKRTDHSISPFLKLILRPKEFISLNLSYKYLKNFSTLGEESTDYTDLNYDRHRVFFEISGFF